MRHDDWEFTPEENKLKTGDLVRRMIATHYTNHQHSDAVGVVLKVFPPLAQVYFYDTNKEETWNQKVLKIVTKQEARGE
tara:strand:+ start:1605 stop:1841 length:237 start_codon:yes stop_codon:yes gene_type:complete